jgi:hypothetical protein
VPTVYRKSQLSRDADWHFYTTCSAWPQNEFDQVIDLPSSEPLCAKCVELEKVLHPRIKLRDHPLMTRISGIKTWPPLWVEPNGPTQKKPRGEIGVLKRVEQDSAIAHSFFIWIEYGGERYVGMMVFDDPNFCQEIFKVLEVNVGLPIEKIGDIDLSYTL